MGPDSARAASRQSDQARTGAFRGLLILQAIVAGFFGLVPFVAPGEFARLFQLRGDEPYLYRLAGAATVGYAVVALLASWRPRWAEFRIPLVAVLTFNVAAFAASLISIDESGVQPLALLVTIASAIFVVLAAYWLYRDQGDRSLAGPELEPAFRVVLVLATVAAAILGVGSTLLPRTLMELAGFAGTDLVLVRLAGAAALGYAVAGVLQLLVNRWAEIRLQVIAAIVFNTLSAVASAIYLAGGGRSLVGILILLASTVFTFLLTGFFARAER